MRVVPASIALDRIQNVKPENLPEVIKNQPQGTEFVLIDAPNGLRSETVAAIRAGKELLLVTTPEVTAVSDAMKTRIAAEFLGLKPIGIVLNQVHGDEYEIKKYEIEDLMNLRVLAEIPYDNKARGALREGIPLLEFDPKSKASKAIKKLAEKIVEIRRRKK